MAFSKREPKVYAVLPAGGTGERFGQAKQFCLILGQPLLRYTLDSFERYSVANHVFPVYLSCVIFVESTGFQRF